MTQQVTAIADALQLLREGKTQEADDLLASTQIALQQAEAEASGKPPPSPAPRPINVILQDLAEAFAQHIGSPAPVRALMKELNAAVEASTEAK